MYRLSGPRYLSAALLGVGYWLFGCSLLGCSGGTGTVAPNTVTLALAAGSASLAPSATTAAIQAVVGRSTGELNSISLSATGVPAGVSTSFVQPLFGTYGSITFSTATTVTPGIYPIVVQASEGSVNTTSTFTLTVLATDAVSITPATTSVLALQNGTTASDNFTVTRSYGNTNTITVSASNLPTGLLATFTQPAAGSTGSVTFTTATVPAAAGLYNVTLVATDGVASGTTVVAVNVGIVATVANAVNTSQGISGRLMEFMSTGFQPSTYDNGFFPEFPSTTALANLNSQHIRIQTVQNTEPWKANSSPQVATDWSFTAMDQTVQPVLTVGDNSPTFQIASAPLFLCDSSNHFIFNTANLQLFTQYAQNLVRYYNTGGFDWGGQHFQSASTHHITWWAIFNEANLNNITAAQYVQLYNTVVPAMLTIDPTLKFVALELSDYTGQPQVFLPQLVLPAASGGLNAQINAISTHFYGSCNQTTTDATEFTNVAQFVSDITYFRNELQTRSDLANVPVWVTENNINADFEAANGYSNCNPTQLFVSDLRGTSGFFTSWRPYIFSQLGKAGNQALYHFLFEGSSQYGEVLNTTDGTTLAYWTDYWLEHVFPVASTSVGSSILTTTTTEPTPSVELLAVQNADNSVSLMVTNRSVASSSDDNGNGGTRTVQVNLSALGTFSAATQITLNAATSVTAGPTPVTITPTTTLTVNFTSYGSTMFILKP